MSNVDQLTDAEVDNLLERFDQTEPHLQRRIIVGVALRAMLADARVAAIRQKLENIVCTEGVDKGVVLLSHDAPTHWDESRQCRVYNHEYFSPLGDALIELYEMTKGSE